MPRDMFQLLVCPPERSTRRWYALPLSLILHGALLAAVIVVPLVATDVLPTPRTMLAFMTTVAPPSVPPAVPPRRTAEVRKPGLPPDVSAVAPLDAPTRITPEPSLDLRFDGSAASNGGTGMLGGLVPGGLEISVVEAPPPRLPTPQQPVTPGGQIKAPVRTKAGLPTYPAIARATHVEGDVLIEAVIGPDGKVQEARVLRSISLLDEAALDAVRSWEYTPTLLNGQPVPVILTVTVRFRLN